MKVSVVIPVLNDPRIGRAIDSVRSQKYLGDLEVVVIDGGSSDATPAVLNHYRKDARVVVYSEPDGGIYDAINKGIQRASGELIGYLGADDTYAHTGVLEAVSYALRRTNAEVCYGDLVYDDEDGRAVRLWRSGTFSPLKLYLGWAPPHPAVFIRKACLTRCGPFDTRYTISADYAFWLRLFLRHKATATYLPCVLTRMTLGGCSNNSLNNIFKGNIEKLRAWHDLGLCLGSFAPLLNVVWKAPQFLKRPVEPDRTSRTRRA